MSTASRTRPTASPGTALRSPMRGERGGGSWKGDRGRGAWEDTTKLVWDGVQVALHAKRTPNIRKSSLAPFLNEHAI